MVYEDELKFSGSMTQLETEQWIQNMEDHMKNNNIVVKDMVQYALQYFEKSAATWWKMHHAIQGFNRAESWEEFKKTLLRSRLIQKHCDNPMKKPCACKICGEIGHTHAEHKDGCPHCEENHPAEECPTRQVTCFLCEGTTHYPAQCHIYPVVHRTIKQQKEALKESLEDPVMKEDLEDKDEEGPNNFYSKACYSRGEEGRFSQYCTKKRKEYLGDFPTVEVEYGPLEIEALIGTKKRRKRNRRHSQNSPISAKKDQSYITCFKCKTLGHYANMCPGKEPRTQGAYVITKKPLDLSDVICFRCKVAGHFAGNCPNEKEACAK